MNQKLRDKLNKCDIDLIERRKLVVAKHVTRSINAPKKDWNEKEMDSMRELIEKLSDDDYENLYNYVTGVFPWEND